jgi:hypothetical protein
VILLSPLPEQLVLQACTITLSLIKRFLQRNKRYRYIKTNQTPTSPTPKTGSLRDTLGNISTDFGKLFQILESYSPMQQFGRWGLMAGV